MRAKSVSRDEQYRLIMECRSSGLSDFQWCVEHGIKPGTFYNWVKRLRQQGCANLPSSVGQSSSKEAKQEVVKIERSADVSVSTSTAPVFSGSNNGDCAEHAIELLLPGVTIRIRNGAEPRLLEQTLQCLRRLPQC